MPAALMRMADLPELVHGRAEDATCSAPSTVKVDWALDGPIPWANPDVTGAGTVHVAGAESEFLRLGRSRPATACPTTRSCCSASRASPTRRARPRASTPPGRTRTVRSRASTGQAATPERRRAHGGAGRALRPGLPRPHPRPPRARPRRPRGAATRTWSAATSAAAATGCDQVVFRPLPKLTPYTHAAEGPVHRQRGDVPGRRRPRRAGRRRRARRAQVIPALPPSRAVRRLRPVSVAQGRAVHIDRFARALFEHGRRRAAVRARRRRAAGLSARGERRDRPLHARGRARARARAPGYGARLARAAGAAAGPARSPTSATRGAACRSSSTRAARTPRSTRSTGCRRSSCRSCIRRSRPRSWTQIAELERRCLERGGRRDHAVATVTADAAAASTRT